MNFKNKFSKLGFIFWQFVMGENPPDLQQAQTNLAVLRILFFGVVFVTVSGPDYFLQWTRVPAEFWHPRGIMRFLSEPLAPEVVSISFFAWQALTIACMLGVFFRWLAPVWWALGLVVMTNGHSFGYQGHVFMPVVVAGLPLCFSHASDALSVDRFWRGVASSGDARAYHLPIRTVQIAFVLAYFAAGISKLRFGGLEWMTGDTLRNYLVRSSLIYADSNQLAHMVQLNEVLYRIPLLCNFVAFGAVALELAAPLALWRKRYSMIIVPAIISLQIGIFFTMYVRFTPYIALLGAWVNWHWLIQRANRKR